MLYSYPDNGSGGYFIRKLHSHFKLSYANLNEECLGLKVSMRRCSVLFYLSVFNKITTLQDIVAFNVKIHTPSKLLYCIFRIASTFEPPFPSKRLSKGHFRSAFKYFVFDFGLSSWYYKDKNTKALDTEAYIIRTDGQIPQ